MIGPPLIQAAVDRDWQVTVLNRQSPPPAGLGAVRHLAGDRGEPDTLHQLAELEPDVVVDLSCYEPEHVDLALQALVGRTARYVMMSSAAVYTRGDTLPLTESHPLGGDPLWGTYGSKKLENERIVERYSDRFAISILRAPYIVGHPDFMNRLQFVADRIAADSVVHVSDTGRSPIQLVSPVDAAHALLHLCDIAPSGPEGLSAYNLGNAQFSSLSGLVRLLSAAMGHPEPQIVPVDLMDVGLSNAPFSWTDMVFPFADAPYVLDDSHLRATGFLPTFDLEVLLADFVHRYPAAQRAVTPSRYPAELQAMSFQPTYLGA